MRQNLPVTAVEYPLADGRYIVSKTDLKGRITYVNPYFIEVSGFNEQELIGAPHNLVRHPDMPAEAFRDLWSPLQAGLPWPPWTGKPSRMPRWSSSRPRQPTACGNRPAACARRSRCSS